MRPALARLVTRLALRGARWQPALELVHRALSVAMGHGGSGEEFSGERAVLGTLGAGAVVFDVGANRGDFARLALETRPAALHCFEPSPAAREALCAQVGSDPAVRVWPVALGDHDGEATLYADAVGSPLASLYKRDLSSWGVTMDHVDPVRVRRLDTVCSEAGVTRIDLLKLDVEGHELAALRGAGGMLVDGSLRRILFEFGGTAVDAGTHFRDYYQLLEPYYDLFRLVRNGAYRLGPYRETMEIYLTTNYLAVWRSDARRAG